MEQSLFGVYRKNKNNIKGAIDKKTKRPEETKLSVLLKTEGDLSHTTKFYRRGENAEIIRNSDKTFYSHDTLDHTLVTSFLQAVGVNLPKAASEEDEHLVLYFEDTLILLDNISGHPDEKNLIEKEIVRAKRKLAKDLTSFNTTDRQLVSNLSEILFLTIVLDKNLNIASWKNTTNNFFRRHQTKKSILDYPSSKVVIESIITPDFFSSEELEKYKPLVNELSLLLLKN